MNFKEKFDAIMAGTYRPGGTEQVPASHMDLATDEKSFDNTQVDDDALPEEFDNAGAEPVDWAEEVGPIAVDNGDGTGSFSGPLTGMGF